jgi:hypothetical protein
MEMRWAQFLLGLPLIIVGGFFMIQVNVPTTLIPSGTVIYSGSAQSKAFNTTIQEGNSVSGTAYTEPYASSAILIIYGQAYQKPQVAMTFQGRGEFKFETNQTTVFDFMAMTFDPTLTKVTIEAKKLSMKEPPLHQPGLWIFGVGVLLLLWSFVPKRKPSKITKT